MPAKRDRHPKLSSGNDGFLARWTRVIQATGTAPESTTPAPTQGVVAPAAPRKGQTWWSVEVERKCRVMCSPVDGWLMARYGNDEPPFVVHIDSWHQAFKRTDR